MVGGLPENPGERVGRIETPICSLGSHTVAVQRAPELSASILVN